MPDLIGLLKRVVSQKTMIYVASQLDHEDTARIRRWVNEDKIPGSQIVNVYNFLKAQGVL